MRDRIELNKKQIPMRFTMVLAGKVFTFWVSYNKTADLFTISLFDRKGELLCAGEPLIYGMPLFRDVYEAGKFPAVDLVPWDESGQEHAVTWDNLGTTVFLTLDNERGKEDG